jgi:hypothetical protein
VVPQRLEEGEEIALEKPELELALGQPVTFPLYTSTVRGDDHAGDLLQVAPDQLGQLPPLHTILRGGKRAGAKRVPVLLAARCTEIGTLELWCVARDGGNRWRLEFNVRDVLKVDASESEPERVVTDVWPEAQVQEAGRLIRATYDAAAQPGLRPQDLMKALEAALDAPRHGWPTGLCRPGFGDPLDKFRVEQLWKLMHAPQPGQTAARGPEGGTHAWIMWRRVAGGLHAALQHALVERLRPALLPARGKGSVKPGADEFAEMWRLAAGLERLDLKNKEALGQALLKPLRRSPVPTYGFWSLTRLGARVLLYGPLNTILHPQVVERWLDDLLGFLPGHDSERIGWAFCLSQLARRTGQRALDVDDSHRQSVRAVLRSLDIPESWLRMVEEVTESGGEDQSQMFGESLPIGLRLLKPQEE